MNIVIAGAGKVGAELVRQLSPDHRVTVIDQNAALIDNIINVYDVQAMSGSCASIDVLAEAGADRADLLITTTSSDEINILSCLVARKLGTPHTIARIRNPEYEKQLRFMRSELGLSMAINPEKAAAREISRILRFPAAMKVESFSKGRLELVEYRVPEGSRLDGVSLLELYRSTKIRVLICAVARGEETFIPGGSFTLRAGDKVYLTSTPDLLTKFFQHLGVFRQRASSVIIVGASKMCYYLAEELLQMGMSVRIIDQSEARCVQISEQLPRALVIVGDGTDSELLREEGIREADAFVAITGIDEANILMSMSAARQSGGRCKVIAKINRRSLVDLVENEDDIDCIVSARNVTADLIVQYVRAMVSATGSKLKTLHHLVDGAVEALEFHVPAGTPLTDVPLKDLGLKDGILLAGIVRQGGQIVIPSGLDTIRPEDDVIIVTTGRRIQDLREILR
ncbi:MAG: Trk system potassium transporter TrkA [Oscillibacter sp.]|nr:Trk system potassium transporter TrkA [Oscillibacter sp.]